MKIHKILNKLKNFSFPTFRKYSEINGVRYYKIYAHTARVEFDESLGFYVGIFENMRAMTCFYAYYEADIHSAAREALRSYLSHCEMNQLNPYKE